MGKFADLKSRTEMLIPTAPKQEPLYHRAGKQLGIDIANALTVMLDAPMSDLEAAIVPGNGIHAKHDILFNINTDMGWFDVRIDKLKLGDVLIFDDIMRGDSINKMLNLACLTFVSKHPDLFAAYEFDGIAYAKIYINDEPFDKPHASSTLGFWKWLCSLFAPHKVGV